MNFLHPDTAFQNPAEGMGRKAFPARTERAGSSLVEDEEAGRRDNGGDDNDADENLGGLQHSFSPAKYPAHGINYQSKLEKTSICRGKDDVIRTHYQAWRTKRSSERRPTGS